MRNRSIYVFVVLGLFISHTSNLYSQNFIIQAKQHAEANIDLLLSTKQQIREDSILNERILDLVSMHTVDSVIQKKYQHHRLFAVGWIIHKLGYHWISVDYRRHKVVGTLSGEFSMTHKEHYTEYDVNLNLIPHIPKYMDLSWKGYQYMKKLHRRIPKSELSKPPFVAPTFETIHKYRLHCELTPDRESRLPLNTLFYPTTRPSNIGIHPNIGERTPSMGVYGPLCLDCNHHCGVEIHPYEWLWWMDLNPQTQNDTKSTRWLFMFSKDGSNRFAEWSTSPRTGTIAFPFVLPASSDTLQIDIEPILMKNFDEVGMQQLTWLPSNAHALHFNQHSYQIKDSKAYIIINNHRFVNTEAWKYWISDLSYNSLTKTYTGYIHFAGSVSDLFCASLTCKYN